MEKRNRKRDIPKKKSKHKNATATVNKEESAHLKIETGGNVDLTGPAIKKNSVKFTPKVIYLDVSMSDKPLWLEKLSHILISNMVQNQILRMSDLKQLRLEYDKITKLYKTSKYHVTLFRVKRIESKDEFDSENLLQNYKDYAIGPHIIKRIDLSTRFEKR